MRYFLATDHAGVRVRDFIVEYFRGKNLDLVDFSPSGSESVDYPDYAKKVCLEVLKTPQSRGILVCGSGIGMSITANRFKGIRAGLCTDAYMAEMTRRHNDANVLCLGERVSGLGIIESILDAFVTTEFEGGRHLSRIEKIDCE
ncbi:ribose 5-phosphate isomerase B [Helicobacter enhydrae]|uniref:Ribose 5-phosphate isomerase B n=1 Tax=Helicobacter enhydrae TaxID=222136 RepID=A0A1B1U3W0_9HELI|nr:ribose 5-phosphate isomerase B [Helicobacter enhydrae]ANV97439.1 ribose 5-phosphate isomerase B [Helicobacter enhydrae]